MARRVDPLKAKQAKQKKMAIGLCVVFAAVLAFQGPKTMKMLKGPQVATPVAAATTPATTGTTPADPIPAPVATPPGGAVAAGAPAPAAAQPAVLVDSDVPPEADEGQLRSFELFQAKDPFAQQAGADTVVTPQAGADESSPSTPGVGVTVIAPSPEAGSGGGSDSTTPPAAAPPVAAPAAPASATSISVNGVAADVAVEGTFPAEDPAFVLVSVGPDGKSVQIGVAGGVYADGAETIKLALGKPVTLRNTADGSQYVLLLNTVAGFAPPKQK